MKMLTFVIFFMMQNNGQTSSNTENSLLTSPVPSSVQQQDASRLIETAAQQITQHCKEKEGTVVRLEECCRQ